jgi:hypothetical protein
MTIENETVAGALSAGIDTEARPLSDIKAMAEEILAHIDLHYAGETASIWLANARSALKSAVQYVEGHFAELEAARTKFEIPCEPKLAEAINKDLDDADAAAAVVTASNIG